MDNYAITGLLALNATLGTKWGTLALLMVRMPADGVCSGLEGTPR